MRKQKFHRGDLVRIAAYDSAGDVIADSGHQAIVIGSYADQFGGHEDEEDEDLIEYTLYFRYEDEVSWFDESRLTLIARHQFNKLKQWKREASAKSKLESDLDWIFCHGKEVLKQASGDSVAALAGCSVDELWGSHGEGFTYFANAEAILRAAKPYLEAGDKQGWLDFKAAHES